MHEETTPVAPPVKLGTPEEPCCPLDVLDESYRSLNRLLKWMIRCIVCIAAHVGCELPERPDTSSKVMVARSAGWGNGNKS